MSDPTETYSARLHPLVNTPLPGLPASLAELYQLPRAVVFPHNRGADASPRLRLVELHADCKAWLEQPLADDALRRLSGASGSGKTSFARAFAAGHQGHRKVFLFELGALTRQGTLADDLGRDLAGRGWTGPNPLDPEQTEPPCLLLLDGLDQLPHDPAAPIELSPDSAGADPRAMAAIPFLGELADLLRQANLRGVRLQALVTMGDDLAQRLEECRCLPGMTAYELLPFAPVASQTARLRELLEEPAQLDADRRQPWWQAFAAKAGLAADSLLPQLDQEPWRGLTALPLGCHLLARSLLAHGKLATRHRDLDGLWQEWVDNALPAAAGQDGDSRRLLTRALEEAALLAWQRGTAVLPLADLAGLDPAHIPLLIVPDGAGRAAFIHPGLQRHLAVRRLLRAVHRMGAEQERRRRSADSGWSPAEALLHWVDVAGRVRLDSQHFAPLLEAIRAAGRERAAEWQASLGPLLAHSLRHGMPVDRLFPRPSFDAETRLAANAELNLLVVLQSCARTAETVSAIAWPSPVSLARLITQPGARGSRLVKASLAWLDFRQQSLHQLDLEHADLAGSDLREVSIDGCSLRGANLARANLEASRWRRSFLGGVNLSGACLHHASFDGVDLDGVTLRGADLRGVALRGIDLAGRDLDHANLEDANLTGANLANATLRSANLQRAVLVGTDLSNSQLQNADFSGANLASASLRDANCKGTRFTRAVLDGANVQGAQLRKADVRGTVLDRHFA